MKRFVLMTGLLAAGMAGAAEMPVLNAENGFGGIQFVERADARIEDGVLRLTNIAADHFICLSTPPYFAAEVGAIEIRYRASGMNKAGGQIFYAPNGVAYSGGRKWRSPSIETDGEWHVLTAKPETAVDPEDWRKMGVLDRIRIDLTDAPGGTIEIAEIAFRAKSAVMAAAAEKPDAKTLAALDADPYPPIVPETWPAAKAKPEQSGAVEVVCRGGVVSPARAAAGERVTLRFDFAGERPAFPIRLRVSLFASADDTRAEGDSPTQPKAEVVPPRQSLAWDEELWADGSACTEVGGNVWRVSIPYTLPTALTASRLSVRLESPSIRCLAGEIPAAPLEFTRCERMPGWEKRIPWRVGKRGGLPVFLRDGRATSPLWGFTVGNRRHSEAPLDLVTVANSHLDWWPRGKEFDPTVLDREAERCARLYPEAMFMFDLSVYPPPDWRAANPDEMCRDQEGNINKDVGDREINFSFASKKALADMQEMLGKALRHLENSPYANRIAGYRVNSGHTIEWLGWSPSRKGTELDFSPVAQRGFEEFAKANYPELTDFSVPTLEERTALDAPQSAVWDQQRHLRAVAYHDFYSQAVADAALSTCRHARELVGRDRLIGTYFGYSMTLMEAGRAHMRAHFATKRFLDNAEGVIDFLMSPPGYSFAHRALGNALVDMKPFASMQAHGIVPVVEDDTRTHMNFALKGSGYFQCRTEAQTVAEMRRNMGFAVCRGEPFYTYAITSGSEFDFPRFAVDCTRFREAAAEALAAGAGRHAEIAVVVSEEMMKAMPKLSSARPEFFEDGMQWYDEEGRVQRLASVGGAPVTGVAFRQLYTRLARLGAPVDYRLAEDLADHPGDYRLYVFVNCLKAEPSLVKAAERLRQRDCTLLWSYAPGFVARERNSTDSMKALTGLEFAAATNALDVTVKLADGSLHGRTGHPVFPRFTLANAAETFGCYADGDCAYGCARTGAATSVFYGSYDLDLAVLREVTARAGVHVYSGTGDPVEASDGFVTLHARFAGKKTIRLPKRAKVRDVFNDRLVAEDADSFTFDATLHSSWLFRID